MKLLAKEQQDSYENAKICYICKEKIEKNICKIKNIVRLQIMLLITILFSVCLCMMQLDHHYQNYQEC